MAAWEEEEEQTRRTEGYNDQRAAAHIETASDMASVEPTLDAVLSLFVSLESLPGAFGVSPFSLA